MKTAAVLTLGCKVNQFESSSLIQSLAEAGYHVVEEAVGVSLVILNTCTVTQKADQEALALIRRVRRLNPSAKIVATGCLAQANPELLSGTGEVVLVLGQDEKASLTEHLETLDLPGVRVSSLSGPAADFGAPLPELAQAFYKIQDGCSAYCTYCAVPISRGPSRSLGLTQVLDGLRQYLTNGLAEVALCGIHLGQWGNDLTPRMSLSDLIHIIDSELAPEPDLFRLRLSSIEPLEWEESLLEAYEMYGWLAPHFHLPLQSGSDRILKLMGRPYQRDFFRDLILKIKHKWPLAGVGIDVMAGFPGENEDDFQDTLSLLQELPITYFNIFPYSPRPGTKAASSLDQVPEHLKAQRFMKLEELNKTKQHGFNQQNLGLQEIGLVENSPHRPSGRLKVLTGNYLSALLPPEIQTIPAGTLLPIILRPPQNPWGILEAEAEFYKKD